MLKPKRLHIFLLKDYLLSFLATFFVCLFVLLMQSLWKYIDEMVGKGLDMIILAQFFYYAALSLVPMALPLAILLSSLMSFGGLGERLELIAMKAAGISLFRIMKPYIFVMVLLSISSFYFSNVVMPDVQLKWTVLLRSIRHKNPEVSIPVGSFYTGIDDYSIYVRSKNKDTKILYDMMIYDFTKTKGSSNTENIRIVTADSGMLVSTSDQKGFMLKLYSGETFENLKSTGVQTDNASKNIPFRRETFSYRELIIDYDNSMNMVSEESVAGKQNTKNLEQLTATIDSLTAISDSLSAAYAYKYSHQKFFGRSDDTLVQTICMDTIQTVPTKRYTDLVNNRPVLQLKEAAEYALSQCSHMREDLDYFGDRKEVTVDKSIRRHDIERHRKFTLSFACMIFFFIGAPLGAIIRKGGFGMPVVISIFLFIIYYIVDNMGFKFAKNGSWSVASGIWLSSVMLFPLGIYLTYQAAVDATFNFPTIASIKRKLKKLIRRKNQSEEIEEEEEEQ